jgi:DNA-binding NarL/FixJ family response regulator
MPGVPVALISPDQFFREGLNGLLSENGYAVTGKIADYREVEAAISPANTPIIVLVDLPRELENACDQLSHLRDALPGVIIVAFSEERDGDWVSACKDYEVGALLRKNVSFKALFHCLELVIVGETVLPNPSEFTPRRSAPSENGMGATPKRAHRRKDRDVIPCMTCGESFESENRRSNRICPSCKSRLSRSFGSVEHTLHF